MFEQDSYIVKPSPKDGLLNEAVMVLDHTGQIREVPIITERPLTLFLNSREIVTMMTVNDYPELLAVGYLVNQNMLKADDVINAIDYDEELEVIVVRTDIETDYEDKLRKKTLGSGCAQGTSFGDVMEKMDTVKLSGKAYIRTDWLMALLKQINTTPSLYMEVGAIHGCVLCKRGEALVYFEDVGRHNALDKIAGYMYQNDVGGDDKVMYTTGRMTSEMVIKTVQMDIPILISRSGSTAQAVELAKKVGLTLISRARGKRFMVLAGHERVVFDDKGSTDPMTLAAE